MTWIDAEARGAGGARPLRARALRQPLEPHEIGRALFHLDQRRGFKSNRRADWKDNEKGRIGLGVKALQDDGFDAPSTRFSPSEIGVQPQRRGSHPLAC